MSFKAIELKDFSVVLCFIGFLAFFCGKRKRKTSHKGGRDKGQTRTPPPLLGMTSYSREN